MQTLIIHIFPFMDGYLNAWFQVEGMCFASSCTSGQFPKIATVTHAFADLNMIKDFLKSESSNSISLSVDPGNDFQRR